MLVLGLQELWTKRSRDTGKRWDPTGLFWGLDLFKIG